MSMTVYGIPNCDTVKKARAWLVDKEIDYRFHDFRKDGIDAALVGQMLAALGAEKLVNKRGTTWRKLDSAGQQAALAMDTAAGFLAENPTLIKRPVIAVADRWFIGFSKQDIQALSEHLML